MSRYSENYKDIDWSKEIVVPEKRERRSRFVKGVISDTMPAVVHPSNGRMYDSKSAFRAETRARGLTEVGNEKMKDTRSWDFCSRADVANAIRELGG